MGGEKTRGELGEIRASLSSLSGPSSSRPDGVKAKKDVLKKIVNYTTVGIDMSSLFMQVVNCAVSSAEDVQLKKMLYLYISTYAQSNPELTLLTINLLTKDCQDQDPTIRGLALRSLCSLRVANLIEYLVQPIRMGLRDKHPYVRRTAVMGVLKVYHLDKAAVRNAGFLEDLREMLTRDPDAQVVSNCMSVLQQAGIVQGMVSRELVIPLLNRIKDFSEWAQCQVLEVAAHYQPASEQEVYDVMNVLDDRLAHSNSAVVMATVKLFLHLTLRMPATHQQVLERIKDPLQTLIARDHYETAYAVLTHFLLIVQRAPVIFSQIYTSFYCRQHEPSYIKAVKLEILAAIADEGNAYEIATELTEYVNDIDEPLARGAVRAVGRIALEVQDTAGIAERLLGFLQVGKPHVTAETLIQIKDLLRRYPEISDACIAAIAAISPEVAEPEAKAAFVWILGEYGQGIQDAPYLLEPMAEGFAGEDARVRLALLTAAAKLFFKRPPECQALLGAALAAGAADSDQDVHDRALLYYRLLQQGAEVARRVIHPPQPRIAAFSEETSAELRDRIFDEFNSLAVVYQQPAAAFVCAADPREVQESLQGMEPPAAQAQPPADEGSSLLGAHSEAAEGAAEAGPNGALSPRSGASSQAAAPAPTADLLGGSDDLLGGLGELSLGPQPQAAAAAPEPPALQLRPAPALSPADFQRSWGGLQPAEQFSQALPPATLALIRPTGQQGFCQHFARAHIATMASGGQPPAFRFYFHAQQAGGDGRFLVELLVNSASGSCSVTLKSDAPSAAAAAFGRLLRSTLSTAGA